MPTSEEIAAWVPKKKVLLATPSNRGLSVPYTASLINTMASQRVITDQVQVQPYLWPGESLIERARNDILRHFFYETDCTHLFFIDDDIAWEPDCFYDILATDKDVIGGVYPIKTLRWDRLVGVTVESEQQAKLLTTEVVVNGADRNHLENHDSLVVTRDLGTGFLCISRNAIGAMIEQYKDEGYASNARGEERKMTPNLFGLFIDGTPGTMESTLLSEDYAFCRRWQRIGGLCWVHTGIPVLTHVGTYFYGKFD